MPTFYDLFREGAGRWPDNVAVEFQRRDRVERYTYADLRRMAESIGRWLTGQGLGRGSRVAILALNHPRWAAAYLGIVAAGGAVVPLDATLQADQVAKLLKDSGSSWLFCDVKHLAVAVEAASHAEVGIVLLDGDGCSTGTAPARVPPPPQESRRRLTTSSRRAPAGSPLSHLRTTTSPPFSTPPARRPTRRASCSPTPT
jgi:acyl-CoA synthetase (AMP-forming)/AMP-acid ligase II